MVADKKKFDRIGRIVWLTRFLISGQNFFCPPPYYAVWNHPYLIILSAFSFSQSFNFVIFFTTKVLNEIKILFRRLAPKNQYYFDVFFSSFRNSDITWQKTAVIKKTLFQKIWLDDQHFHASESRDDFWIYIGNQQHPKLSTRTYGSSHVF